MSRRDASSPCQHLYVNDRRDFSTFKITKLQYNARYGWGENGHIHVNKFRLAQIKEFLSIVSTLDLSEAQKTRVSLDNIHVGALGALLSSTKGADLIGELASTPELHQDIYVVAAKRAALTEFKKNLVGEGVSEPDWQEFFERNPWILGTDSISFFRQGWQKAGGRHDGEHL